MFLICCILDYILRLKVLDPRLLDTPPSYPRPVQDMPGADMTPKLAAQKLMFALGRAIADKIHVRDRIEYGRHIIHTPYAKEIRLDGLML